MFQCIVLLLVYYLIDAVFNATLGKYPIDLYLWSQLRGHPIPALPVASGTEVYVEIDDVVCLLEGDALPPTHDL